MSDYHDILRQYWGYSSFRPLQEDIVESAGSGTDTLALMPTGGGKSITFQVPALAKEGICLVITPLIALMKDQVENLKSRKIKAMAIHSGMTRDEISIALDNCIFGGYKFLYLSPERLLTPLFRVRVQQMNVNLIAVDEAHCISQWGYDFRPSYLQIASLRELLPEVPVLALTATATPRVAKDIMDRLEFRDGKVLKKSYERKNLVYVVRNTEDKQRELLNIAEKIKGTGVVYVRNRRKTRELADLLAGHGHSASNYHAGLKFDTRMQRQEDWQKGKTRIMVSTNAFGMGIDKPDVRFVVHMDLPDSPEAYFQEAGRAGRDEKKAYAILLFSGADEKQVERRIEVNFPSFSVIREIYNALFNYLQIPVGAGKGASCDFIMGEFLSRYKFNALTVTSALAILSREGYFEITEEINNPSRIHFTVGRDDLYKFQVKNPKFDNFIKLILRSYTGLFSQYVAFDEYTLSKRAGMSGEEVYQYLVKLSGMKVINYIPKKQNPVVTLLEERLDEKNIHISAERYKFRKERYLERIGELLAYAGTDRKCRSQFLLAYFGELSSRRCGQCDVCIGKKDTQPSTVELEEAAEKIRLALEREPGDLSTIAAGTQLDPDLVAYAMQHLQEEGKIRRRKDLLFEISEE
ncbi:MAG: RecQ family ATP-dependent DNA helicase [Bacteroidales bacterium]|nr:RecQ family ATP-dependent DNA helicase [Bacteroidales bacterium]MDT8432536.1 ATP-dependent DNA helicase RecQ [Bacteroidales bacterium]